jgi:L-rhamnose isomerase
MEKPMSKTVVAWIVEEANQEGEKTFMQSFDSYDEALAVYNSLKEENEERFVSIQRSEKKLLTEG